MEIHPARLRRWTRAEYERLTKIGVFHPNEPIELLGGELMVSDPQGSAPYTAMAHEPVTGSRRPRKIAREDSRQANG